MRDILEDLEAGEQLSDPDPVRRAQLRSRLPLPKRFYASTSTRPRDGGFAVLLDGKPALTPGRAVMVLPTLAAAELVAAEFGAQDKEIDPATMPVLRTANSAQDGVARDPQPVADEIVRFAGTDLLLYRADSPEALSLKQAEAWDPVLAWAGKAMGARFNLAGGVVHVAQPQETLDAVRRHLAERSDPFRLAALHVMTTLTGSALLALAVEAGELGVDEAWSAAHVDEDWNIAQWGEDREASARRAFRKAEMAGAAALIRALNA